MIDLNVDPIKVEQNFKDVNRTPWIVSSIFDFQYFCCPECNKRSQDKQDFVNHVSFHSDVSFTYYQFNTYFFNTLNSNDMIYCVHATFFHSF